MNTTYYYFIYGLQIHSDLELPDLQVVTPSPDADVKIELAQLDWQTTDFQVQRKGAGLSPNKYFTVIEEIAFYVANGNLIQIDIRNPDKAHIIHSYLYSSIFAALLIQNDYLLLHASVIAKNDQAFAFVARSGRGKSTTASYFLKKSYHLVADDICAIKFNQGIAQVYRAFPSIKLWGATIEATEWNRVGLKKREERSEKGKYWVDIDQHKFLSDIQIPLAGIFFISFNQEISYTISRLENLNAMKYLTKGSFRYGQIVGMNKQATHFKLLSNLVKATPIYRAGRAEANTDIQGFCEFLEKQIRAYSIN